MLKTETGLLVAINYQRVVIGQRGPYIEFKKEHLAPNYFVPPEQEWRLTSSFVYYIEYRTTDKSRIKIYFQQKTVSYADYKIGFFYISPVDLYLRNECVLQEKARSPQLPLW